MSTSTADDEKALLQKARSAASILADLPMHKRDDVIRLFIETFGEFQDHILETNTLDLETSRDLAVPAVVLNWLKLTPDRLKCIEPIFKRLLSISMGNLANGVGMASHSATVDIFPIGVIALVYEALPELALITAGMCIKTGNALILKGGAETSHTNEAIALIIRETLAKAKLSQDCVVSLPANRSTSVDTLVKQSSSLDLVIPYGRPSLVQQVVTRSTVPVIQTCIGNCYLYWSNQGAMEHVRKIVVESHRGWPEAVNAVEKILIPPTLQQPLLALLWDNLQEEGFEIRGDQDLCSEFQDLMPINPEEWGQPYLRKVLAFKVVADLDEGITWMNTYSSGHANCIVTDSYKESQQFRQRVNSATVFINQSPEFSRLTSSPTGSLALGMARMGGSRHGIIDLNSLMSQKQVFQGDGQTIH